MELRPEGAHPGGAALLFKERLQVQEPRLHALHCCRSSPRRRTYDEIIKELEGTETDERSGRSQDKEKEYVMQKLRALGYM